MKPRSFMILLLCSGLSAHGQTVREISLSEALSLASGGNRELQIQTLEKTRLEEATKEARSRLLPHVAAGGSFLRYFDRQVIFLPGSFAGTAKPVQDVAVGGKNAFSGLVAAGQPLFNEEARRQVQVAAWEEKIQQAKIEDFKAHLGTQVALSYFDMLLMQSQIGLLQQSLQRNEKALKDTRSLFIQGRSLKADTLRAFVAVENLRSSISYLHTNLHVAGIRLKRLIGIDDDTHLALSDSLVPENVDKAAWDPEEVLETAIRQRNDMLAQKLSVGKSRLDLTVAKAAGLPQVTAVGQYLLQAQADNLNLGRYVWPATSFVGLQAVIPLFAGNRVKAKTSQAEIRIKQEIVALEDLEYAVKAELASLLSQWQESRRQLDIRKRTVALAEVSYAAMDDRYRNGLGTRLELADAELALTQARTNYLEALYNYRVIQVQLNRAQGRTILQ